MKSMQTMNVATITLTILYGFSCAEAQSLPKRYICNFASGNGDRLALEFLHETGTPRAFVIGNAGLAPVTPFVGSRAITFVESLQSGAAQTTTIAESGAAVHSRHTIIVDRVSPSQFSGRCS